MGSCYPEEGRSNSLIMENSTSISEVPAMILEIQEIYHKLIIIQQGDKFLPTAITGSRLRPTGSWTCRVWSLAPTMPRTPILS